MIWKAAFSALGLGSFIFILHGYGFTKIAHDIANLGWWAVPLALSFLPVAFCYALAWLLLTPELGFSRFFTMLRYAMISIGWNNLSPFVKVLGEPVRVVLLERLVSRKSALQSVVVYNLAHMIGTLGAFFLGATAFVVFFPLSAGLLAGFLSLIVAVPFCVLTLYLLPHFAKRLPWKPSRGSTFLKAGFWLRWSLSRIRIFSRREPLRFWLAVLLETTARFVEGTTFYIAFLALGHATPAFTCALLDVGRALMDTIFFFIPYQVGTREGGILLLAEHAVKIDVQTALSGALLYRLVEVLWMGIGYMLWMMEPKSPKLST